MLNGILANPDVIVVGAAGFEPATSWSRRTWEIFPLIPLYALKSPFYCILGTGKACHIPLRGIIFPLEVCTFVCTNLAHN